MDQNDNRPESVDLPLVTVVIANHNYGQWLPHAVSSVLAQDYPNKQIVIVDDASTDGSVDIMKQFLPEVIDERESIHGVLDGVNVLGLCDLQGVGFPNVGPAAARNLAIKATWKNTHLFAILDADDFWNQGKLSKSVGKFLENPERIGAVYTDNYSLNVHTENITREYRESFNFHRLLKHNMIHSGCVISKAALEQTKDIFGYYDEMMRVAEDYDLWIRIAEKFLVYHIPEPLVTIRTGQHNTGNSIAPKVWQENWARISDKIKMRQNA